MKLNYDKKSSDPTYFIQQGFRNGKKTTTKNIVRIGKHSELLKITDDPLAYARILDPDSKLGTYDHLGSYYEQPDFGYVHILRTMDIMAAHYDEYISHLFEHSKKIIRRNTSVCYYDCSNYYVIDEEEKYDGFYAVATNLDDNAKDIIEISSNRYMIEDCFRVMKTNFSARPVFLYP